MRANLRHAETHNGEGSEFSQVVPQRLEAAFDLVTVAAQPKLRPFETESRVSATDPCVPA
jgi:hypothetical protein